MSDSDKWKWLHKDYILKLFSVLKPESIKLYKQFVNKETPEEINSLFSMKNLPSIIGSKSFIEKIRDKFFNMNDFEEVPETKILAPNSARIISVVCKEYKIEEKELYLSRRGHFNEPRNVAIYLVRRLKNDALKHVGEQFGIEKYSTVSSIVERVKHEMNIEKGFKNRVQTLYEKIIKSQRQT